MTTFPATGRDRAFADDPASSGAWPARRQKGDADRHEKGDDTATLLKHNFGMAKPECYRKAIR